MPAPQTQSHNHSRLRIALVSPKGPLYRHRGGIFRRSLRYAPLTLTTLAALVPDEIDHEITLIDEGIDVMPDDLDADLIGITVITGTAPRAYELATRCRERGSTVVLGGPHVTLLPDEAAQHADAIVVGYAEDTWPQLLRDYICNKMKARYVQSPDLSLADRPFPHRDLLPAKRFATTNVFEATRACKHGCEFCVVPTAWGRKQLQKPVGDVIADIRQHKARKLVFIDLNLISDREYACALFEALIPLRVQWYGLATSLVADDDELLMLMQQSGCRGLLIGLESIRTSNLSLCRKGFSSPDRYPELVRKLHDHRIALQGCFVFGFDDDDNSVFDETADLAIEARIDLPRFAILTPFPATPLFNRLEAEERILTKNWELYDGQHVVFQPRKMSVQQCQQGTERAWRKAYSFKAISRRIMSSPASIPVGIAANIGYRFYARNLHRFYHCDWMVGGAKPMRETHVEYDRDRSVR